jgi:drug/metabolite transporter (DMT)-like permease
MSWIATIATLAERLPPPARGALWMVLSCSGFAALSADIRHLSSDLHPSQIVFFRNFFGLVFLLPWVLRGGRAAFRTTRFPLHCLRVVFGLVGMTCFFSALSLMPIAEATALSFTAPLFATLGAALILRETVGMQRWTAILVGFAGTLIILRPGVETLTLPALLALAGSACIAASMVAIKSLSRTDSPTTVVLYLGILITPASLVPAWFVWTAPPLACWPWVVALGLFATFAHLTLVKAFATADASAVLPFDFSRLLFTALIGFLAFGERPDVWTWTGAAVIFAATLYSARHQATTGHTT